MSAIDPAVWAGIESCRPSGDEVNCRVALPCECDYLYCGVDADGTRHLLVRVAISEEELEDSQSRGLNVETRNLTHIGQIARYIDVRCMETRAHAFFDLFGASLARELRSTEPPARVVARELARWRRFWSDLPSPLLTRDEQLGLFAELWFLQVWLYPRVGPAEAVRRWRGPFAARHDFEWPDRAVEVKGTSSQRGRIHHINGLDQLRVPENGRLFLFSIKLRETGSAHNSLSVLVEACRQPILNDPDALSLFENALARSGYSANQHAAYAQLTLEATGELLFEIDGRFPRLTSAAIDPTALAGIERVEYDLNLTAYEQLAMANDDHIEECLR